MKLPSKLSMRATMFGSLRNGGHLQVREDTLGLGIQQTATCQKRGAEWEIVLEWHTHFPGRQFKSYAELVEAAKELPGRYRARLRLPL